MRRGVHVALLIAAISVAAVISYRSDATRGLAGSGIGATAGLVIAGVSRFFVRRAKTSSDTQAMLTAAFGSLVFALVAIAAAIFVTHFLWQPVVKPVALTTLGVYLVHRFAEAFGSWPRPSAKVS